MSKKLCKNLNLLMTESHLNAEELSRRIDLPASTIKKIRNNDDSNPTLSTLAPLAKYFSLTISQLVGDEPFPKSRIKGSYEIQSEKLTHIPMIAWEDAIRWPETHQPTSSLIATENIYSKDAYALLVEEDQWENLAKGTALLVDPIHKVDHRDFIIVHKKGQNVPTLKQVLFDDEKVYLKPLITGYNIGLLTADYKILGVVVEYRKHLKTKKL